MNSKWLNRGPLDIKRMRQQMEKADRKIGKLSLKNIKFEKSPFHDLCANWLRVPNSNEDRILLYIHGGAFISRMPKTHAGLVARLCAGLSCTAVMVEYRLSPEHTWPLSVDDCFDVYKTLLESGISAEKIVIAGDSAGGNLALSLLHRIKQEGLSFPACACFLSPVVDFTLSSPSILKNSRRDVMFNLGQIIELRNLYCSPEEMLDPTVSPLYGDFLNFPPLLFQVSDSEMFLDESTRTAAKAADYGVKVHLEIWGEMPHVFQGLAQLPQSRQAIANIIRYIFSHTKWD